MNRVRSLRTLTCSSQRGRPSASIITHYLCVLTHGQVLLAGWSGGGSLSSFYQSQAELGPRAITHAPAGDQVDLPAAELIPADGLLIMAAHASRARIFTEW